MALKAECFADIDIHTLESVLARETLNCKEMHLFEAALNWASAECLRQDLEPTPQNKRSVLGNALYLIRIPTMSLEEFANGAAQLGILTHRETIDIFLNFTAHNKPLLNYPIKPRTGLRSQVFLFTKLFKTGESSQSINLLIHFFSGLSQVSVMRLQK